ncbi:MAG: hypothetical protein QOH72_2104 [Solirubrobacteraceae bacterium]|nr:hypothetical protein [Solirubrobacteraceae bacterium]
MKGRLAHHDLCFGCEPARRRAEATGEHGRVATAVVPD